MHYVSCDPREVEEALRMLVALSSIRHALSAELADLLGY